MSGREMYEHVRQLSRDIDVPVWLCIACEGDEPWGQAVKYHADDSYLVVLTHPPDTAHAYLVALHELGHHAEPGAWKGPRLDREARAWQWAREASLLEWGPAEWAVVAGALGEYGADRRFKRTPIFEQLLSEAERNAA